MRVPVLGQEKGVVNVIYFDRFLPDWELESINFSKENFSFRLGFDADSVAVLKHKGEKLNYSKWANVPVESMVVEVAIKGVSPELKDYIKADGPPGTETSVQRDYYELGKQVYDFTISQINRFILYVKTAKGHYWLEEYNYDPKNMMSLFNRFRAKAKIEDAWYRWDPSNVVYGTGVVYRCPSILIGRDDLLRAQEFLQSHKKAPLVRQLLAEAEYLRGANKMDSMSPGGCASR